MHQHSLIQVLTAGSDSVFNKYSSIEVSVVDISEIRTNYALIQIM